VIRDDNLTPIEIKEEVAMNIRRVLVLGLVLALLLTAFGSAVSAQDAGTGRLRFVHAVPGVEAVDVYVNGSLAVKGLSFGTALPYLNVPAGQVSLRVTLANITTVLWEQTLNVAANDALTLVASSTDPLQFDEIRDDLGALSFGATRLLIYNAIRNSPGLDIQVSGANIEKQTIIIGMGYKGSVGPSQPPANVYNISAVITGEGGEIVLDEVPFSLVAGVSNIVLLVGTPSTPQAIQLAAPTAADGDAGLVRFAHGVEGAPAVDIAVNGTVIAAGVTYGQSTPHIALPAGDHNVGLRLAGAPDDLVTADVTVASGVAATAIALGSTDAIEVALFEDTVSGIDNRTAHVSIINTISDSSGATVTLADGTALATDLEPGAMSDAVALNPPAEGAVTVEVASGESTATGEVASVQFYGGVYYNGFVINTEDGPTLVFAPTGIAQSIDSAPGAAELAAAVEPTPEPVQDVASSEIVQATPTPAPAVAQPTVAAPATSTDSSLPTARVLLDPGANLQLREYPNSDARSLGLAPSGSTLTVNGRIGAPIDILTGNVITLPDGSTFEDPALALTDPAQDLVPSETWLNVNYATADGGTIEAWVNALYLDVRSPRGEQQRLADLPTIPQNQPGERVNTVVTPPPLPTDVVIAEVFNLDPTVNLNIRRQATTQGEVLARVNNGTQLEFLGLGDSGEWVFVSYRPAEGGEITGWASQLYLRYIWSGRAITLDEMVQRNLFVQLDEVTTIGEVSAGASPAPLPTLDPLKDAYVATVVLDPGANLNLRRFASDQAEVLAQIPANSQIVVTSRTADGLWLETSFQGADGWVASRFVTLTFNGRPAELEQVPVNTGVDTLPEVPPAEGGSVG
jgi:uncharacterized protein YgiM (DUF1202 family)